MQDHVKKHASLALYEQMVKKSQEKTEPQTPPMTNGHGAGATKDEDAGSDLSATSDIEPMEEDDEDCGKSGEEEKDGAEWHA